MNSLCSKSMIFGVLSGLFMQIQSGVHEYAVETLLLPVGAKEIAMGEIGLTLQEKEAATFWNPALLGYRPKPEKTGSVSYQFDKPEGVIPWVFDDEKNKIRMHSLTLHLEPKKCSIGGFEFNIKHLIMPGEEFMVYEHGSTRTFNVDKTWETIWSLSYGTGFKKPPVHHHFGITAKYIKSALAPGLGADGEGIGRTFAFDLGYLWKIDEKFSAGLCFANMGPSIYYITPDSKDPLPFKGNIALGYTNEFNILNFPLIIVCEYKVSRFFVKNNFDGKPDNFIKALSTTWKDKSPKENWQTILHNFGYQLSVNRAFHLRQGFYFDNCFKIREMHWGFGISLLNHGKLDFYHIYSPSNNPDRHGAWGFTTTIYNLFSW